jgi:hypothetical protein
VPPSPAPPADRRLGTASLAWRLVALGAGVLLALYGALFGTDDLWPFSPQTQFAFFVSRDGQIRSAYVDAVTLDGRQVRVPLNARGVGIARAEIEGQLSRIVADPSLLQGIADAQRRLHPDQPQYAKLFLREEVTTLRDGRAVAVRQETKATWDVTGPSGSSGSSGSSGPSGPTGGVAP